MAVKTERNPAEELGRVMGKLEEARSRENEFAAQLNERGLQVEKLQASEAAALERTEKAEAAAAKLRDGWAGRESQFEAAVTRANEAAATCAVAVAARVAAEDELSTLRVLASEAQSAVNRLEPENRQLREQVAAFDARVRTAEAQIETLVQDTRRALEHAFEAAVQAIAPTSRSLRVSLLELATAVPEDADKAEALSGFQEELAAVVSSHRVSAEHDQRAAQDRAAMVRRNTAAAAAKLEEGAAQVVASLR